MSELSVTLDLSNWTRLREVDEYAAARETSLADAIRQLVNAGLTHVRRDETGRIVV
jgi:hypothetical protein